MRKEQRSLATLNLKNLGLAGFAPFRLVATLTRLLGLDIVTQFLQTVVVGRERSVVVVAGHQAAEGDPRDGAFQEAGDLEGGEMDEILG